jgi:hypothetical protein
LIMSWSSASVGFCPRDLITVPNSLVVMQPEEHKTYEKPIGQLFECSQQTPAHTESNLPFHIIICFYECRKQNAVKRKELKGPSTSIFLL